VNVPAKSIPGKQPRLRALRIDELLEKNPDANAPVIAQRLKPLGFDGGFTIIKDYLRALRKNSVARRAYVRVELSPGERFDVVTLRHSQRLCLSADKYGRR
jgi:hypothetical protein